MKIEDYDITSLPNDAQATLEDLRTIANFGKYQWQVVTAFPTWRGRQGESVVVFQTTGALVMCTTDNAATWRIMTLFNL